MPQTALFGELAGRAPGKKLIVRQLGARPFVPADDRAFGNVREHAATPEASMRAKMCAGPSRDGRVLTRDAEAIHVHRGTLALAVRVNSEVFRPVAIGAVAAVRGQSDFRRDSRPRLW